MKSGVLTFREEVKKQQSTKSSYDLFPEGDLREPSPFLGDGSYRQHFFGDRSPLALLSKAIGDQLRYSTPAIKLRRRTRARLAQQTFLR